MRASVRVAGRVAGAAAFAATAALAISLTRGGPESAALTSQRDTPTVSHDSEPPRCDPSRLDISIALAASAASHRVPGHISLASLRFPVDFTNTSGAACSLSGYPEVSAYRSDGMQVGKAAALDTTVAARRIVLAPGATAHAAVVDAAPGARCRPVAVLGLRIVPPGEDVPRYIRHTMTACSASGRKAPVFLHVRAVQPGTGIAAGIKAAR